MENSIEVQEMGLICDNPKCDWKDETVRSDQYLDWLNKPCPKCGENVLTDQDYENVQKMFEAVKLLNRVADLIGFEESTERVKVTINTHEKISIKSIEQIK